MFSTERARASIANGLEDDIRASMGRIYTDREVRREQVTAFTFGTLFGFVGGATFGVLIAVALVVVL
jgi:hypothetical protein